MRPQNIREVLVKIGNKLRYITSWTERGNASDMTKIMIVKNNNKIIFKTALKGLMKVRNTEIMKDNDNTSYYFLKDTWLSQMLLIIAKSLEKGRWFYDYKNINFVP